MLKWVTGIVDLLVAKLHKPKYSNIFLNLFAVPCRNYNLLLYGTAQNVMSHSPASIFLESRYSMLFSQQVLAQIL